MKLRDKIFYSILVLGIAAFFFLNIWAVLSTGGTPEVPETLLLTLLCAGIPALFVGVLWWMIAIHLPNKRKALYPKILENPEITVTIPYKEPFFLSRVCVVCGRPATAYNQLETAAFLSTITALRQYTYRPQVSLSIPYCAEHLSTPEEYANQGYRERGITAKIEAKFILDSNKIIRGTEFTFLTLTFKNMNFARHFLSLHPNAQMDDLSQKRFAHYQMKQLEELVQENAVDQDSP